VGLSRTTYEEKGGGYHRVSTSELHSILWHNMVWHNINMAWHNINMVWQTHQHSVPTILTTLTRAMIAVTRMKLMGCECKMNCQRGWMVGQRDYDSNVLI
jgi:hypothetical protein